MEPANRRTILEFENFAMNDDDTIQPVEQQEDRSILTKMDDAKRDIELATGKCARMAAAIKARESDLETAADELKAGYGGSGGSPKPVRQP